VQITEVDIPKAKIYGVQSTDYWLQIKHP
jgi:hypothetical protein